VSYFFGLVAAAVLALSLSAPSDVRAADIGYEALPGKAVSSHRARPRQVYRVRPREERFAYPGDLGVMYPYRNYWDRYTDWNRYQGRYYHGRYAYRTEAFPDGFWWW
jgi:hypothetical protein